MSENLSATPASSWQKTHFQKLPSGNIAELKRVALIDLIAQGRIPNQLMSLAIELSTKDRMSFTAEQLKDYEDVVNVLTKASFVTPKVTDIASDEVLSVHDIDWIDRVNVYYWCNGVTTLLRPFRPEGQARPFNAS